MADISTKPYLLRAIYEWCSDNGYTPYIAVRADARTRVPQEYVKNGEIVLNISFSATHALKMDNDLISFNARFSGVSREISVPVENVLAIYASENGQGMAFEVLPLDTAEAETGTVAVAPELVTTIDEPPPSDSQKLHTPSPTKPRRPNLKFVK